MLKVKSDYCPNEGNVIHCVSLDGAMETEFASQVPRKHKSDFLLMSRQIGGFVMTQNNGKSVYHLITKLKASDEPTFENFEKAVISFCQANKDSGIEFVSPLIGYGLDKLPYNKVLPLLDELCYDYNIDWTIFNPKGKKHVRFV